MEIFFGLSQDLDKLKPGISNDPDFSGFSTPLGSSPYVILKHFG